MLIGYMRNCFFKIIQLLLFVPLGEPFFLFYMLNLFLGFFGIIEHNIKVLNIFLYSNCFEIGLISYQLINSYTRSKEYIMD